MIRYVVASFALGLLACSSDASSSSSSGATGSVSFKRDVAPIFAKTCALSACHGAKESNLNFYVTFDPAQIYTQLLMPSATCPSWKYITPGKPDESMVMLKMDNKEAQLPVECSSARRSEMPPGDPPGSGNALASEEDRATVRRWITDGAKND